MDATENDFRFHIEEIEDDDFRYRVTVTELVFHPAGPDFPFSTWKEGEILEVFVTNSPYDEVEAAREVQCIPMEERWAMYAERGW